jgi:formate hydrogenlyase subunit 3/multisubunit Na+/H+ antiporter MnhD subunit
MVLVQAAVLAHWSFWIVASLALAAALVTLVYYAKVQREVLGGAPSPATADAREAPLAMSVATAALAVLCLAGALALHPAVKSRLFDPAVAVLSARGLPQAERTETAAAEADDPSDRALPAPDAEVTP